MSPNKVINGFATVVLIPAIAASMALVTVVPIPATAAAVVAWAAAFLARAAIVVATSASFLAVAASSFKTLSCVRPMSAMSKARSDKVAVAAERRSMHESLRSARQPWRESAVPKRAPTLQ